MLFIEWWIVRRLTSGLLLVLASFWLFWSARKKRSLIRFPLQIVSLPMALLSSLFFGLTLLAIGCQSYGKPLYSPNGKLAVRTENSDEGGLGGATSVVIYRWHGFNTSRVYDGSFLSVEDKDLHWISDSELHIDYTDTFEQCRNAGGVTVHCVPNVNPAQR